MFFHHVPKTAGTTLTYLLTSVYGEENTCPAVSAEDIGRQNLDVRNFDFIHGHFTWQFAQEFVAEYQMITTVRDPIKRILSQYRNLATPEKINRDGRWADDEFTDEVNKFAHENDFSTWIRSDHPYIRYLCDNFQAKFFTCYDSNIRAFESTDPLDEALTNIQSHFLWVGITESFNDCIDLLGTQMCDRRICQENVIFHNVSGERIEISEDDRQFLRERNSIDIPMYEACRDALPGKISAMRDFLDTMLLQNYPSKKKTRTADNAAEKICMVVDNDSFYAGWSFLETVGDLKYRWSNGDVAAKVGIPLDRELNGPFKLTIEVVIINTCEEMELSDFQVIVFGSSNVSLMIKNKHEVKMDLEITADCALPPGYYEYIPISIRTAKKKVVRVINTRTIGIAVTQVCYQIT